MDTSKLRYVLLPAKYYGQENFNLYNEIYKFWSTQWSHAFKEIGLKDCLPSDEFLRQSEVSAIFLEETPVACVLFDWFDLTDPHHLAHSYFDSLNVDQKDLVKGLNLGRCLTFNYLAVDPAFRGQEISMIDLAIGLAVKRLKNSQFENAICFCRNTRKIHELLHRMGGKSEIKNVMMNGEPSDFGVFDRSSVVKASESPLENLILSLWDAKIIERNQNPLFSTIKK